jgi:MSHA biogenesis protein MshK
MKKLNAVWILALWLPLASSAAGVEVLPDPTRPAEMGATSAPTEGTSPALVLQSIILGKGRPPAAIISGQVVHLGGMVGEARLTHLAENYAVLSGRAGEITLQLTPTAEKHLVQHELRNSKASLLSISDDALKIKESAGPR